MNRAAIILVTVCLVLVAPAGADTIRVLPFSQQYGRSSASIGASITVHQPLPRRAFAPARPTATGAAVSRLAGTGSGPAAAATEAPAPQAVYPTLPASSPRLQNAQPLGPGSFWYQDGTGQACAYVANASPSCYTVITAGAGAPPPAPLNPAAIAAQVADQLALTPGQIQASPGSVGLTGAASWFLLSPAPQSEQLSATLAGEEVTVTATPQIEWEFGDGTDLTAGAGVPYRPGAVPADAVTHIYQTRCLPGDQGNDPYVLASCGSRGYPLSAVVVWQISYQAGGSVTETGTLPTRTTTSTIDYPVSEVRAFLTGGTGE